MESSRKPNSSRGFNILGLNVAGIQCFMIELTSRVSCSRSFALASILGVDGSK